MFNVHSDSGGYFHSDTKVEKSCKNRLEFFQSLNLKTKISYWGKPKKDKGSVKSTQNWKLMQHFIAVWICTFGGQRKW